MRLVKYLIALPFVGYALVMGYLWLQVKSTADEMVEAAAGFADIHYDSIFTSLTGNEVGLNNIVVKPLMTNDEFRIEKVRLSAPHIGYFIQAESTLKKGGFPEKLGINIERMHLDLNSEIFTMLEQGQSQASSRQPATPGAMLANIDTLGCGDKNTLTLDDYRRMGITNIVTDASVDTSFDKNTSRATVQAHVKTDNYYTIDINADFDSRTGRINPGTANASIPEMQISYTDTGIYKLRNKYCSSLNNSDIESYVTHHIQLVGEQLGVVLPEAFLVAYKDYMLNGGTISASLSPVSDASMTSMQYYPPDEVVKMLGLQIRVNETTLDNKKIRWVGISKQPRPKNPVSQPKKNVASPPRLSTSKDNEIRYRPVPKFHRVDVRSAEKHINKIVEVTLYNGRVRKGILDKVNEGRLYLVLELQGGTLSYPVKISDVENFRVRY